MKLPDKERVVEILESIARLLELKGENPFKIRAYTNAARALETFPGNLEVEAREGRLEEIPGIGRAIAEKLTTLLTTGRLPYYDRLRDEFPPEIFQLFELQGLGARKVKVLYDDLQVHSIPRLERACRTGKVAALPGFGEKTVANILRAIEQRKQNVGKFLLGQVASAAEEISEDLRAHAATIRSTVAGSYRRGKEVLHDLDFVVSSKSPDEILDFFTRHPLVAEVLAKGTTKASVRLESGLQCDLRVVRDVEYPFALAYFTGSKEHNIALRNRALERGWTLNEYRLAKATGRSRRKARPVPGIREEAELYAALDLQSVPPELREARGEIEAAEEGSIPRLIEWHNLRGTFHVHTTDSDGHNTLEEMAAAASELGFDYLGIADHSKSSFQAHGLD